MPNHKPAKSSKTQVATAQRLAGLVRDARLARRWTQVELAERARVGVATIKRIESGSPAPSLGSWLAAFDGLGLLPLLGSLKDPAAAALLRETQRQRARRTAQDLDF